MEPETNLPIRMFVRQAQTLHLTVAWHCPLASTPALAAQATSRPSHTERTGPIALKRVG